MVLERENEVNYCRFYITSYGKKTTAKDKFVYLSKLLTKDEKMNDKV